MATLIAKKAVVEDICITIPDQKSKGLGLSG